MVLYSDRWITTGGTSMTECVYVSKSTISVTFITSFGRLSDENDTVLKKNVQRESHQGRWAKRRQMLPVINQSVEYYSPNLLVENSSLSTPLRSKLSPENMLSLGFDSNPDVVEPYEYEEDPCVHLSPKRKFLVVMRIQSFSRAKPRIDPSDWFDEDE